MKNKIGLIFNSTVIRKMPLQRMGNLMTMSQLNRQLREVACELIETCVWCKWFWLPLVHYLFL